MSHVTAVARSRRLHLIAVVAICITAVHLVFTIVVWRLTSVAAAAAAVATQLLSIAAAVVAWLSSIAVAATQLPTSWLKAAVVTARLVTVHITTRMLLTVLLIWRRKAVAVAAVIARNAVALPLSTALLLLLPNQLRTTTEIDIVLSPVDRRLLRPSRHRITAHCHSPLLENDIVDGEIDRLR